MTMQTITAERDVQLVKRSPLNPLRRLLRKPLPTYSAPLFAEALVRAERDEDLPTLRIEEKAPGRFSLAVIARPGAKFFLGNVVLRERGAQGRFLRSPSVDHRTTDEEGLRVAGQAMGKMVALVADGIAEGSRQGGVVKPGTVMAGERGAEVFMPAPDGSRERPYYADRFQIFDTPSDTPPEAPSLDLGAGAAVLNPAWAASPAPTHDSTVLHDLQHVAELLETAQFEIAMTPGGDAAGSSGNSAWKALKAVETIQRKLGVMADAADLAAQELTDAQRRAESQRPATDTGLKRNLNRAASMLRMVTDRLPMPPATESKSV